MNVDVAITFLSGGKSRRMGEDKASLVVDGKPLLLHNVEDAIDCGLDIFIASAGKRYDFLEGISLHYVDDIIPNYEGPLSAMIGAIDVIEQKGYVGTWVMATDQLVLPSRMLSTFRSHLKPPYKELLYAIKEGESQPLIGWYPIEMKDVLLDAFNEGKRNIRWVESLPSSIKVEVPTSWYHRFSFNTPEDLRIFYEQTDI